MQSCLRWLPLVSCLSCPISCSTTPGAMRMLSALRLHIIHMCMSSAHCPHAHIVCMSSVPECRLHTHVICTSSAELLMVSVDLNYLSTLTGSGYWMEFVTAMLSCFISGSYKWFVRSVLMVFSACRIWTLFTCYLHMYMSSTHYLGICILCAHYLQWSLIYSFLTDNADVIHMSSLVLFIYPIMYNLVSAHCLHRCTLSMSFACCPHMYTSFACHLYHSSYTLLSRT